jgi:hypothetical protein
MTGLLTEYLTRKEMAAELGRSESTLRWWEQLGVGPPLTRIGKLRLYRRASVAAWIEARDPKPLPRGRKVVGRRRR